MRSCGPSGRTPEILLTPEWCSVCSVASLNSGLACLAQVIDALTELEQAGVPKGRGRDHSVVAWDIACVTRYAKSSLLVVPRRSRSARLTSRRLVDAPGATTDRDRLLPVRGFHLPERDPRTAPTVLAAQPDDRAAFIFHLKHGVVANLPAAATVITDPAERHRIFVDFVEDFDRRHGPGSPWPQAVLEDWVAASPLAKVSFQEAD